MLEGHRIFPFIFTFLPAFMYAAVIYMSAPVRSIGRRMSQLYFQMGIISATVTSWFLWVFPSWQVSLSSDPITSIALLSFFQIAFLEEGMKFAMFKATERYRTKSVNPWSIMFYSMCISCGFAVMENVMYLQMYGSAVLILRAFSAIILHMITGLLMGYFLAMANMPMKNRHINEGFGLFIAIFYHGLYDFNIMVNDIGYGLPLIVTLGPGLLVTYFMWRHLTSIDSHVD